MAGMDGSPCARSRATAGRLGVPVDRFHRDDRPVEAGAGELLRLWADLGSEARRGAALAYLRGPSGEGTDARGRARD